MQFLKNNKIYNINTSKLIYWFLSHTNKEPIYRIYNFVYETNKGNFFILKVFYYYTKQYTDDELKILERSGKAEPYYKQRKLKYEIKPIAKEQMIKILYIKNDYCHLLNKETGEFFDAFQFNRYTREEILSIYNINFEEA